MNKSNFWQAFGPGILFAGAAVGTSHLVQATRAGALYGLELLVVVLFAYLIKYPIFRFGPLYATATGKSLLQGYRSLGKWAVILVAVTELPVNIIIVAATAIVTAGLILSVFHLAIDAVSIASVLIALAFLLVTVGGYRLIDRCTKVFVAVLTVCTFLATILVLPDIQWSASGFIPTINLSELGFLIALMGFMPAGISLSVIHSIWSLEKAKATGHKPTKAEATLDLDIGYIGSALLAICFLFMGAGVLYTSGTQPASSAGAFANQVISLYSETLGAGWGVIVGVSAITVMLSTLLTALDGFARVQASAIALVWGKEVDQQPSQPVQRVMTLVIGSGAILVLFAFMASFKTFIDFVTTTVFIVGPVIAILNHLVMHRSDIPAEFKPGKGMRLWSVGGIVTLVVLSLFYLFSS